MSSLPPPRLSLELEPNPFEMSFKERESTSTQPSSTASSLDPPHPSQSGGNGSSSSARNSFSNGNSQPNISSNNNNNNSLANRDDTSGSQQHSHSHPSSSNTTANPSSSSIFSSNHQFLTPGGRRILPPMSSISSPSSLLVNNAHHGAASWSDSLRSGPLSPAMLQGPAPQQSQHSSTSVLSSSLLSLANSTNSSNNNNNNSNVNINVNSNTNNGLINPSSGNSNITKTSTTTNNPAVSALAANGAIRPGPLSLFLQGSLLGSDSNGLFPTPGPATAAILNSLNNELIGSTGLTPLPLKPGSTSVTSSSSTALPAVGSIPQAGNNNTSIPIVSSSSTSNSSSASSAPNSISASASSANSYNGSVDAAASLYMMSKGGSQQYQPPPQLPIPLVNSVSTKRETSDQNLHDNNISTLKEATPAATLSSLASSKLSPSVAGLPSASPGSSASASNAATASNTTAAAPAKRGKGAGGPRNKRRKGESAKTGGPSSSATKDDSTHFAAGATSTSLSTKAEAARSKIKKEIHEQFNNLDDSFSNGNRDSTASSDGLDGHAKPSKDDTPNINSSSNLSSNSTPGSGSGPTSKADKKKLSDEEKRKSFLERNRIAALKCRQRKKQWTQELQGKVETYASQNEALTRQIGALQEELLMLRSTLRNHQNCSVGLDPKLAASLLAGGVGAGIVGANAVAGTAGVPPAANGSLGQQANGLTLVTGIPTNSVVRSVLPQPQDQSAVNTATAAGAATGTGVVGSVNAAGMAPNIQQLQNQATTANGIPSTLVQQQPQHLHQVSYGGYQQPVYGTGAPSAT